MVRRLRVHGRVQGVGFRAFVFREAVACGVAGWVRNRRDGTVEALVVGEPDAVEMVLDGIRRGPRWARVDRVEVAQEARPEKLPTVFAIRSDC